MIVNRVPLPIIQKIVGWSAGTLAKMVSRYGHFSIEEMRSAMESAGRASVLGTQSGEVSEGYPQKSPKSAPPKLGGIQ